MQDVKHVPTAILPGNSAFREGWDPIPNGSLCRLEDVVHMSGGLTQTVPQRPFPRTCELCIQSHCPSLALPNV
jgi:hypothetical protein